MAFPSPAARRVASAVLLFLLLLAGGCQRNWRGIDIKKRVYLDGYYIHIPSKRATSPVAYQPPAQTPTSYPKSTPPPRASTPPVSSAPAQTSTTTNTSAPPISNPGGGGVPSTGGGGNGGGGGIAPAPPASPSPAPPAPSPSPAPPVVQAVPQVITPVPALPPKPYRPSFIDGKGSGIAHAGLISGPQYAGYPVKWYSFSAGAGFRFVLKLRPMPRQRFVLDLGYRLSHNFIDQEKFKVFPLTQGKHVRERVTVNDLTFGLGWRFRFRSETSFVKWIDAGVCGSYALRTSNVFIDEQTATYSAIAESARSRTKIVGLNYLRDLNYGVTVRAGNEWLGAFATWRLSDMIPETGAMEFAPDMPKLTVGVEVSTGW